MSTSTACELEEADLERVNAGKDVRDEVLTAVRSVDRAAKSADREINKLGKSLGI